MRSRLDAAQVRDTTLTRRLEDALQDTHWLRSRLLKHHDGQATGKESVWRYRQLIQQEIKQLLREMSTSIVEGNAKHDFSNALCSVQWVTLGERPGEERVQQLTWDDHDVILRWPPFLFRWIRKVTFSWLIARFSLRASEGVPHFLYKRMFQKFWDGRLSMTEGFFFKGDILTASHTRLRRLWYARKISRMQYWRARIFLFMAWAYTVTYLKKRFRKGTEYAIFPLVYEGKIIAAINLAVFGSLRASPENWLRIRTLIREVQRMIHFWSRPVVAPVREVELAPFTRDLAREVVELKGTHDRQRTWLLGLECCFAGASPEAVEQLRVQILKSHYVFDPTEPITRHEAAFAEEYRCKPTIIEVVNKFGHFPSSAQILTDFFTHLQREKSPYRHLMELVKRGYVTRLCVGIRDPLLLSSLQEEGFQEGKDFEIISPQDPKSLRLSREAETRLQIIELRRPGHYDFNVLPGYLSQIIDNQILENPRGFVTLGSVWGDPIMQAVLSRSVKTSHQIRTVIQEPLEMEELWPLGRKALTFARFLKQIVGRESVVQMDNPLQFAERLVGEIDQLFQDKDFLAQITRTRFARIST